MTSLAKILIVNLGSQLTYNIERVLRERGFRSMVLTPRQAEKLLLSRPDIHAIILSGSGKSVYADDAQNPPEGVLSLRRSDNNSPVPILGICYGMQWLVHHLGGMVQGEESRREYGPAIISANDPYHSLLLHGTPEKQRVWASHGDSVIALPPGFIVMAQSESGTPAAIVDEFKTLWAVQFHPESTHTEYGSQVLYNFVHHIAGCEKDWNPTSEALEIKDSLIEEAGNSPVILPFSGGVDSTTAALLASRLRDRLQTFTIDADHLRFNERPEIAAHAEVAGVNHEFIHAPHFTSAIARSTDAEIKRKTFKRKYGETCVNVGLRYGPGAQVVMIQGTLATDMIESGALGTELIKSHHNVGLQLPRKWRSLHPLNHLFKYEVRALAQSIGLPPSVYRRQPFPGPGLYLRVVGVPATFDMLELVRWADARTTEILRRHKVRNDLTLYDSVSQLVVYVAGINLVGVKGDIRAYNHPIVVRALQSEDFITGEGVQFPPEVRKEITRTLTRHSRISSVLFEETDKPPRTTEPE